MRSGLLLAGRGAPALARAVVVVVVVVVAVIVAHGARVAHADDEGGGAVDPAAGDSIDRERVRAEVESVLSDPSFQRTRPDGSLGEEPAPPDPPDRDYTVPDFGPKSMSPSAASGVSEALLWVLFIVLGVALVGVLGRETWRFSQRRTRARKKKRGGGLVGDDLGLADIALERLPASLARAKELAAAGRFEEAVHVLLEGALGYLHALANFNLEPAFTSREVLARAPLTSETRRAFGDLVGTVEVSLFGGLAVGGDDFARCEASFVTLHRRLGSDHGAP